MISQLTRRAVWTMPGIAPIRGMALAVAHFANQEEYVADLLALICESALRGAAEPGGMLLNYSELPEAAYEELARHFRCNWSDDELRLMQPAATRDAKQPHRQFSPDHERKQREAGERVREICERKLEDVYRRLETKRRQASTRL